MNIIPQLRQALVDVISTLAQVETTATQQLEVKLNVEKREQFGDVSCNVGMLLAKIMQLPPREIAQRVKTIIESRQDAPWNLVEKIEIAGPGFLNFYLKPEVWVASMQTLLQNPKKLFGLQMGEKSLAYHLEFVSANPTGPVHLGGGRGGIIGDVLARALSFLGHKVHKEYYINDAGNQIKLLGQSFKARCFEKLGEPFVFPEGGYAGDYMLPVADKCVKANGKALLTQPDEFFEVYAKDELLKFVEQDLTAYGVVYDQWFSEKSLHDDGSVAAAIKLLQDKGLAYEKDGALWFKATDFGDDKDRVLRRSNGEMTYIAADVAYHKNKFDRGFDRLVDILGQDHHGYVKRLQATMQAIGYPAEHLDVIVYQLVSIKENDELVRMSKRAGTFTKLADVLETVGKDVARYFYLNRRAEAHLEFDLGVALKRTDENPVFYLQYAFVRAASLLAKAREEEALQEFAMEATDVHALATMLSSVALTDADELVVYKKIMGMYDVLRSVAYGYQTHQIAYYAYELATVFHAYYANHKIIDRENVAQTKGRLALVCLVKTALGLCLELLGVEKPERM
jgi:arginyl-tRNA synthetase